MAATALLADSARSLGLRVRADLIAREHFYQGRRCWIVKDPLSLRYYRFDDEEHALLHMLDGPASLADLQRKFEQRFAPQTITAAELHRLLAMAHRANLVVSDAEGQGKALLARARAAATRRRLGLVGNLLAVRLPGANPDPLLTWLERRFGWFFSRPAAALVLLAALAALLLVACQFDTVCRRMPTLGDFFSGENVLLLAVAVSITKVLHELGHGVACKRFGGHCHEAGLMLLVLSPCLYVNVSDSWLLPDKWRRAAVGAAGMYVELAIAAACTFLWWLSAPGLLNSLCLNVMFVCSVGTLGFNANPLLRFDGYYILSDLLEIPNLRQRAEASLRGVMLRALGLTPAADPFLPAGKTAWLGAYAVAAFVYRWVMVVSILWLLYHLLAPYGLKILSQMLAAAVLLSLAAMPLIAAARFLRSPGRTEKMKKLRIAAGFLTLSVLAAGALFVPLPYEVPCAVLIRPRRPHSVYAEHEGEIASIDARYGNAIRAGEPLVTLSSLELQLAEQRLQAERRELLARRRGLERQALGDEEAAEDLAQVDGSLAAIASQLAIQREKLAGLRLVSPADGVVLPPPPLEQSSQDDDRLGGWTGRPLEEQNLGGRLAAGTLVCQIAPPGELEALLVIDESEVEFVRPGQTVEIHLEQYPGAPLVIQLDRISPEALRDVPPALAEHCGGMVVTKASADGVHRPLTVSYPASAPLDDGEGKILVGARGRAKIHAGYRTVGERLWRSACSTFRFDL